MVDNLEEGLIIHALYLAKSKELYAYIEF